jgi:ABC-type sugar transport system substrate-binding protein
MAIGAALAIEAAHKADQIFIVGGSAQMEALKMMMDGRVIVADLYYPDDVKQAVEGAWSILHGQPIKRSNVVGGFIIWADQAKDYYDATIFRVK